MQIRNMKSLATSIRISYKTSVKIKERIQGNSWNERIVNLLNVTGNHDHPIEIGTVQRKRIRGGRVTTILIHPDLLVILRSLLLKYKLHNYDELMKFMLKQLENMNPIINLRSEEDDDGY